MVPAAEGRFWLSDSNSIVQGGPPIVVERAWAPGTFDRHPVILLLGSLGSGALPDWSTNLVRRGWMLVAFTVSHPPDPNPARRPQWLVFDERFAHSYVLGGSRTPADVGRVLDHLATLNNVDPERIGWLGSSTTGIFGLAAAVHESRVKAIVTFVATGAYGRWLDTWKPNGLWTGGKDGLWPETRELLKTVDPILSVTNLFPTAVLLVNGSEDKVIDPSSVDAFVEAAKPFYAADPDRLRSVRYVGGGHNLPRDIMAMYAEHWFGLYLNPDRPPPGPVAPPTDLASSTRRTAVTPTTHDRLVTGAAGELGRIELTLVDGQATGYATFQSHNQKVVSNRRGIFMTHLRTRNEAYTAQGWRLSQSDDGGTSFRTLHSETNATNPAVLETDAEDNVYLVRPDFADGHAYLYRFLAEDRYAVPRITRIPGGAAGKFSMVLDPSRKRLAYFAHNNSFHLVDLNGIVLVSTNLLTQGTHAVLQYPLLSLDETGALHAAWTTQKHGVYLYWDIHHMVSPDGGMTWKTLEGTSLTPPVVADDTGPATRITLDDEFESHTWLSSFLARNGKVHFLYLAQMQNPRQHYVRYDMATGRREIDMPAFRGEKLAVRNLDGFFAVPKDPKDPRIFCVSRDADSSRLVCLMSPDGGTTWKDYAVSPLVVTPYSIGGCRSVTDDGWIIGSFTEQTGSTSDPGGTSRVQFFRIRATPTN